MFNPIQLQLLNKTNNYYGLYSEYNINITVTDSSISSIKVKFGVEMNQDLDGLLGCKVDDDKVPCEANDWVITIDGIPTK